MALPASFEALLAFHKALEAAASFLIKNKMPCSLCRMQTMLAAFRANGAFESEAPTAGSSSVLLNIRRLVALSGGAIELQYVPRSTAEDPMESADPKAPVLLLELMYRKPGLQGSGTGHQKKRMKVVRSHLVKHVEAEHDAFLRSLDPVQLQTWKRQKKQKGEWHPDFQLDRVSLPKPCELPPAPAKLRVACQAAFGEGKPEQKAAKFDATDPYQLPPAAFAPLGHTGVPKPSPQKKQPDAAPQAVKSAPSFGAQGPFDDWNFINNTPSCLVPETEKDCVKVANLLDHLKSLPFYKDQCIHVHRTPARQPEYLAARQVFHPCVVGALRSKNISVAKLYSHQVEAIDHVYEGRHVVIATPTASGKSLCFNVPVMDQLLNDDSATAMYIFPTKALAQDQLRSLNEFIEGAKAAGNPFPDCLQRGYTLDGDTHFADRAEVMQRGRIVFTNPDMLHSSILPQHRSYSRLLGNLRFVVVDESHMYRGVFGCHVSLVFRRLARVVSFYQQHDAKRVPIFIFCSATIRNPTEHVCQIIPRELCPKGIACVQNDGSPCGPKDVIVWQPPLRLDSWRFRRGPDAPDSAAADAMANGDEDASSATPAAADEGALMPTMLDPMHSEKEIIDVDDDDFDESTGNPLSAMSGSGPVPAGDKTVAKAPEARTRPIKVEVVTEDGKLGLLIPKKRSRSQSKKNKEPRKDGAARGKSTAKQSKQLLTAEEVARLSVFPSDGKYVASNRRKRQKVLDARHPQSAAVKELFEKPRSAIVETAMVFTALIKQRVRTLAFCRVRKLVELVLRYSLQDLAATAPRLARRVRGYRGGYSKAERREIEAQLFGGKLLGVTASNALELGVDIGSLDVTVHLGFPGSISSLRQQMGRAGRTGGQSLAIIILFPSPLDQFFARQPELLFEREAESAVIDPNNVMNIMRHVKCAAKEVPINAEKAFGLAADVDLFGGDLFSEALEALLERGDLVYQRNERGPIHLATTIFGLHPSVEFPAKGISLRMIDDITIKIQDETDDLRVIDNLEYSRAFFELYQGGIYLHQARQYLVTHLDLEKHTAKVRPVRVPYYTVAKNTTEVVTTCRIESLVSSIPSTTEAASDSDSFECKESLVHIGGAVVRRLVYGWVKKYMNSDRSFECNECKLPPLEYNTRAWWADIPMDLRAEVAKVRKSNRHLSGMLLVCLLIC